MEIILMPKNPKKRWTRYTRTKKELACEHGVGHGGIHGCDGCCSDPSFEKAWKEIFGGKESWEREVDES